MMKRFYENSLKLKHINSQTSFIIDVQQNFENAINA